MKRVLTLTMLGAMWTLSGCQSNDAWMPLSLGRHWTYRVRTTHYQYTETVSVSGRAPVGEAQGYALDGPMGAGAYAWIGSTLYASRLGHVKFQPPVPLCATESSEATRGWKGLAIVAGKSTQAVADLSMSDDTVSVAGLKVAALRATVRMTLGEKVIECTSWFAKGRGIVRQEQRTDGALDASLELIRGS